MFQTSTTTPGQSLFGGGHNASHFPPSMNFPQQQDLARSRLQQAGLSGQRADEPTPYQQAETLLRKWDPNSQDTLLQAYLYNAVSSAYAPFYSPTPDQDEKLFGAALAAAPPPPKDSPDTHFIPVLVRGFFHLGERIEYQAASLSAMQARLHEMDNSLNAVMAAHQQRITVGLERRRIKSKELETKTLRLAVKLSVLRNWGYALDAAEEALRKQLITLSNEVNNPEYSAREDEVWARMLALRERARWLEAEGRRLGDQVQMQQHAEGQGGGKLPDYVVAKTRKILKDYDGQLKHLAKELEAVAEEFGGVRINGGETVR